jgi:hypothetical protein
VSLSEAQTYYTGPEYQILDNIHGGDRVDPKHTAGALYDLVAPTKDFTHPVGTWNEARIKVQGWHIEHWLNGEKIVDIDLDSPEGRALKAHSKFSTMSASVPPDPDAARRRQRCPGFRPIPRSGEA